LPAYHVSARRTDPHGNVAAAKEAEIILDTDVNGRLDALNPAELFLAAIAACMIKGIERVTSMLRFNLRGVEVSCTVFGRIALRRWFRSTMSSLSTRMRTIGDLSFCI
jgi:uncharacterized OsmC-like protein